MKLNQPRIDALMKAAIDLDLQVRDFPAEYDPHTADLTDECAVRYDALEAQLNGLYHRIGQLYVDQEIYESSGGEVGVVATWVEDDTP